MFKKLSLSSQAHDVTAVYKSDRTGKSALQTHRSCDRNTRAALVSMTIHLTSDPTFVCGAHMGMKWAERWAPRVT